MSVEKEIGVYLLQDSTTLDTYVGSGDLADRCYTHAYLLKRNIHPNYRLQQSFNGGARFDFVSVPTATRDEAFELEQLILDEFQESPLLLNIARDARYCNKNPTTETREKIRRANLGNKHAVGRIVSEETREKIRESNLNQHRSVEARQRMSVAKMGKTLSPEHRAQVVRNLEKGLQAKMHPVEIEGEAYSSFSDAARQLELSKITVRKRVLSNTKKFQDWKLK